MKMIIYRFLKNPIARKIFYKLQKGDDNYLQG